MFPVGFEPTISAGEHPKTCALDCAATGTGSAYISEYTKHNVQKLLKGKMKMRTAFDGEAETENQVSLKT